jgi:hypothetical protein
VKGDDMAVPKDIRNSPVGANPLFLELFRSSEVSAEREQAWRAAIRFAETGVPPLRFPIYEHLYELNVCAQRMVELLEELGSNLSMNPESLTYLQALIQYVRATTSQDVVAFMSGVELTEEWLFESLRRKEEDSLSDPDDVYFSVRHREKERVQQGLQPRIRFLDETPDRKEPTSKKATAGKAR